MTNISMVDVAIHYAAHPDCDHTLQSLLAERQRGESSTRNELDILVAELAALRARIPLLEAVAVAAKEVWWDTQMPSRWFEDNLHYVKELGHRSREALEAVRANPRHYDAVVSDEVMPELTGTQLTLNDATGGG